MKKLLIATAAVALVTVGTASAADLAYKAPPPPPPPPSWTGCYVDGGIGYGMWNQDHYIETYPGLVPITSSATSGGRGWLGRIGGGCDYQVAPSFVIGAFADWDGMSITGNVSTQENIFLGSTWISQEQASEKQTSAWYVGGRIGYLPYPDLMTFVSGGWTQSHFSSLAEQLTLLPEPTTGFGFLDHTYQGWFIGGGYEYRIPWANFHGLYWKTEYRFTEYVAADLPEVFLATGTPNGFAMNSQKYEQTVTTSLVWKFSWGGPVVAKY